MSIMVDGKDLARLPLLCHTDIGRSRNDLLANEKGAQLIPTMPTAT